MDMELVTFIILRRLLRRRKMRKQKKRLWVHPRNVKRPSFGTLSHLFPNLLDDPKQFFTYFRMSYEAFLNLRNLVENEIVKQNTNYRNAIPPEERLAIFLRYLATGETFTSLSYTFRVGITTIHEIITELNRAVWKTLQPIYMSVPTTQRWNEISESFNKIYGMPNCVGSVHGKHCAMKRPPHASSVVLMAVADANCNFIMIDVGSYGRDNDSAIFNLSAIGKAHINNRLNIPDPRKIADTDIVMPFYFVGNEAFSLRNNFMIPYDRRQLDFTKHAFNYRLSKACSTVEYAFSILTRKYGIFQKAFVTNIELAEASIKSACVLHNYTRQTGNGSDIILEKQFLEENANTFQLASLLPMSNHGENTETIERDKLKDYFCSADSVHWQNEECFQ